MAPEALWKVSVAVPVEAEEAARESLSRHLLASACAFCPAGAACATVSVYLRTRPPRVALEAARRALRGRVPSRPGARAGRIRVRRLRWENWAQSWKQHFKPLEVGNWLLIRPSWSRQRARPGQRVVVLNPGLSFGTGHHPTTWFCLRQVVASRTHGAASFLDLGTGSGILAIAAAKVGYRPIDAIDCDPAAIRVAESNARRNRVESRIHLRVQDLRRLRRRTERTYDVVCGNLTGDLLVRHRREIAARVGSGGVLVMAGILRHEFDSVAAAYARLGFVLAGDSGRGEWRSGRFIRSA